MNSEHLRASSGAFIIHYSLRPVKTVLYFLLWRISKMGGKGLPFSENVVYHVATDIAASAYHRWTYFLSPSFLTIAR